MTACGKSLLVLLAVFLSFFPRISAAEFGQQGFTDTLKSMGAHIELLNSELAQHKREIDTASKSELARLETETTEIERELKKAKADFINLIAGSELINEEEKVGSSKRDLYQEALLFIEPLFDALKRITEKPRRIEGYKSKIIKTEASLADHEKALERLAELQVEEHDATLKTALENAHTSISHSRDDLREKLATLNRRLETDLQSAESLWQNLQEHTSKFISTEGLSLFLAVVIFFSVSAGLLALRTRLFGALKRKLHGHTLEKAIKSLFLLLTNLIAIACVVLMLYLRNDWFLLTTIMFLLLGIVWTSKTLIRVFINDLKLVLNLGPVREGERVHWNGLPWRVKQLGFQSELVNPAFPGVVLRLRSSVMVSLSSRPAVGAGDSLTFNEPWFPSVVGDYVLLDDGTYGLVEAQSPEQVILNFNSARKHYLTPAFLAKNPQNYSYGFELDVDLKVINAEALAGGSVEATRLRALLHERIGELLRQGIPQRDEKSQIYSLKVLPHTQRKTKLVLSLSCPGSWAAQRGSLQEQLRQVLAQAWHSLRAN
jgi:hypothetical protein